MNSLGTELKTLRGQKNLTQSEAAKRIGIEQSFLSKLESDQSWASVEVLRRICKSYAIKPAQLLSQVDSDCLRGNVNYQSLLQDDRKRRLLLVGIGGMAASFCFALLLWAAVQSWVVIPGLKAADIDYPTISLKLEQVPAAEAVRLIADFAQINVRNSALLEGKNVTLSLQDTGWPVALTATLAQLGLAGKLDNSSGELEIFEIN